MPTKKPKRIQRKRTKGWQMPEGAVYVGRPTKWGNPWRITERQTVERVLGYYRHHAERMRAEVVRELRGKDLACFCPLDRPCHADVLLEIANAD